MSRVDVKANPGIRIIDMVDSDCQALDFSNSTGLEHLYIRSGNLKSLGLAKCERLQTLGLDYNPELTDIKISENSSLVRFVYEDTPLNEVSLGNLQRVIRRNGGEIIEVPEDDSSMMYYRIMSDNGTQDFS